MVVRYPDSTMHC